MNTYTQQLIKQDLLFNSQVIPPISTQDQEEIIRLLKIYNNHNIDGEKRQRLKALIEKNKIILIPNYTTELKHDFLIYLDQEQYDQRKDANPF